VGGGRGEELPCRPVTVQYSSSMLMDVTVALPRTNRAIQ